MRGHQKVRDVRRVDFTGDSSVVAGRAGVFEDCAAIWSNPDETKDGGVDGGGGGTKVMDREMGLGDSQNGGQVKRRCRGIADSNDCFGIEGSRGDEIVMERGWVLSRAKGTDVDDGALETSS